MVGVVAHRTVELGGEDDIVTTALERLADDLLRLARTVDVGGVDEIDPGVEGGVDDADRVVVIGVAPRPEHHRAETQLAYRDAGTSEQATFHRSDRTGASPGEESCADRGDLGACDRVLFLLADVPVEVPAVEVRAVERRADVEVRLERGVDPPKRVQVRAMLADELFGAGLP